MGDLYVKKITKYGFITENKIYFANEKTLRDFPTLRDLICYLEKDMTLEKDLFLSYGIELSQVEFCIPICDKVKIICVGHSPSLIASILFLR